MLQMKKWVSIFGIMCVLCLVNASVCVAAQTTDGFTYTELNGVVTITGYNGVSTVDIGTSFPNATEIVIGEWAFQNSGVVNVIIPKNVTTIGANAFNGCTTLQVVTFEERITESLTMGEKSFYGCEALVSLDIPDTVMTIPASFTAFCDALECVDLPNACVSIGKSAFDSCGSLKNIVIPAKCNTIGAEAFEDCTTLASVVFEDKEDTALTFTMGDDVFAGCKALSQIELPANCKTVPDHAFANCNGLISITIPDTCESIAEWAFTGCTSLSQMNSSEAGKVVLPTGCQIVGKEAFEGCTSISKLYISMSCNSLGVEAFNGCTSLILLSFENPNTVIGTDALPTTNTSNITIYCNGEGTVFNYYNTVNNITIVNTSSLTLMITQLPTKTEYYYSEKDSLDISGIEVVAERIDGENTTQEVVKISDCLISGFDSTTIGEQTITVSYGGKTATFKVYVYYNLAKAEVEIDDASYTGVRVQPFMSVTEKETGNVLVLNKDYAVIYYDNINAGNATAVLSGIGACRGEQTVEFNVLPKFITEANTTIVVADMFYTGNQLKPVPKVACGTEPLILDEDYVVTYGTNIDIGKGFVIIDGIGNYNGTIKKWFNINAVSSGDGEATSKEETPQIGQTYTYKDMCYKMTDATTVTFMNPANKKIKKITIPNKVEILGQSFKVTQINKKACYNCKKLNTVTIGDNITTIGDQAFAKCGKLKKVTIGKGLKKIGKKVFYKDKKLSKLIIKSSKLTSVGKGTLKGVKKVTVQAPKKKVTKYKKLFAK